MSDLDYNKDDSLRNTIRVFLQQQLTDAAIDPVVFLLGKDFLQADDETVAIKQIDNSFRTVSNEFTPGMIIEFLGKPTPLKGLELITYTLPLSFLVSTRGDLYTKIKESLEIFSRNLIGSDYEVDGYVFATNADEITNNEQIRDINGKEFVVLSTTVYITSTKDALIGNKIESYFGEDIENIVRIYPTERNTTRIFTEEETHRNDNKESWTAFKESSYSNDFSFIIKRTESIYKSLIIHLEEPTFLNKTWFYRVVYGSLDLSFDKTVGLKSITLNGEIGDYVAMSVVMKKAFVANG